MKELQLVPVHIAIKLKSWVNLVEESGLQNTRRIPGYHDEALKGVRLGQRSIRLSRSYRAIYFIQEAGNTKKVIVMEVNKHDY